MSSSEGAGRIIAALAVLFQTAHRDPVEIAAHARQQPRAVGALQLRPRREGRVAQIPSSFTEGRWASTSRICRRISSVLTIFKLWPGPTGGWPVSSS